MAYQYLEAAPVAQDYANEAQFNRAMERYLRAKHNTEGVMNWWNENIAPAFAFDNGVRTRLPMKDEPLSLDLSVDRHKKLRDEQLRSEAKVIPVISTGSFVEPPLGQQGYRDLSGPASGLTGYPQQITFKSDVIPVTGDQLNTGNQPSQRQLREADPLPTTLAEAYESLGPRAVGDMTLGRLIGRPNNTGFIDADWKLTEEMLNQPGVMWNTEVDTSEIPSYGESAYGLMDKNPGIYNSIESLPAGVGFNEVDLNTGLYDTVLPSSQPKTGLQALRADEKSKGLLYASGKYWAENADGKLEAIPTDLIDGEGTAREQAIAFMKNKRDNVIGAQKETPQGAGVQQDPDRQNELSRALAQNQAWEEQQKGYGPEIYEATKGPVTVESFQPYISDKPMGDAQSMFNQYQDLHEDQGWWKSDAFAKATGFQSNNLPGR